MLKIHDQQLLKSGSSSLVIQSQIQLSKSNSKQCKAHKWMEMWGCVAQPGRDPEGHGVLELCSAGRAPLSSLLFLAPSLGISFQGWDRPCLIGFVIPAVLIVRVVGLRGRACCRGEGRAPSACSFLFPSPSTVSSPNSFLLFVAFAVRIKDSPARRWQGKLVLGLLLLWEGCPRWLLSA